MVSNSSLITFELSNGTYDYDVQSSAGFAATPSAGTLAVVGMPESNPVYFSNLFEPTFQIHVNITTDYGGGVGGWDADAYLNLSNGLHFSTLNDSILFALPNGTYGFTVATGNLTWTPEPRGGVFIVDGHEQWTTVHFNEVYYNLTFNAITGSGGEVPWIFFFQFCGASLTTICGLPYNASTQNLGCSSGDTGPSRQSARNGTYVFLIGPWLGCDLPSGYVASPSQGAIPVNGSDVNVTVVLTPVSVPLFALTFSPTGLPAGVQWWVTIQGIEEWSDSGAIQSEYPNGTYAYTVHAPEGYVAETHSGSVSIKGASVIEQVVFSASSN
ncbi:MAG: hypothetical protein L3K02_03320 [Thermoplasmata archaeon]|nr:hypothetical protein [Thermoplasmata archaeon]